MSNSKEISKEKNRMDKKDDDALSYTSTITKNIEWSIENEMMLVEWCDVAQCYRWLNQRSHRAYSIYHAWFTIPTITLSTITGTASFAQSSVPVDYRQYALVAIGTTNILVGLLNTIQQYLKITELRESHRIASIAWDKYSRNIRIELSKAPAERMDAAHFLKLSRQEYDRLMESSPSIPLSITTEFKNTFSGKQGTEKQRIFEELKKPDICDSLMSSNQYRHHWYLNQEEATMDCKLTDSTHKGSGKNSKLDSTMVSPIENILKTLLPFYFTPSTPKHNSDSSLSEKTDTHKIEIKPPPSFSENAAISQTNYVSDISYNLANVLLTGSVNPFDLSFSYI